WRDCLAAPLPIDGRPGGVLCIFNRSGFDGFEDDELSILQTLADETAAARRNEFLESKLQDRDRLGDMITRTSDGLAGISSDGMIKMWNPALERLTGYSAEEMINTRQMGLIRPRDADGVDVMVELWAKSSDPLPETIQIRTRDGELRWLSCSQTVLPSSDSRQPAMLILLMRDMTRSRELEQLKDEFAATVSHELKAPLTPIKGWAATLLMQGDRVSKSDRDEGVRRILVQAEHLERIIEGLLDMARIEGGERSHFEAVELLPVVKHVIDELRMEHPQRTVTLHDAATHSKPRGNEGWIGQIVRNLLTNAMKYSPPTEPVEVAIQESAGLVSISVTDHGAGIPQGDRDRVFERFQRLDRDSGAAYGVGLGLHIASQLAKAMDGTLSIESEPGKGATFTLSLPAVTSLSVVG
ncbi:MAG: ATP-binding protein, partial [Actinomycetota bacterium]